MPADGRASSAFAASIKGNVAAFIAVIALAIAISGCGGSDIQTNSTSLEKPPLAVPEGSLEASASSKKSGATSSTSSTSADTSDSADTGADTGDADTGTDTGGAGTDTDAGTDTGAGTGADTGGAGPGN
jgi:hypothetical protein